MVVCTVGWEEENSICAVYHVHPVYLGTNLTWTWTNSVMNTSAKEIECFGEWIHRTGYVILKLLHCVFCFFMKHLNCDTHPKPIMDLNWSLCPIPTLALILNTVMQPKLYVFHPFYDASHSNLHLLNKHSIYLHAKLFMLSVCCCFLVIQFREVGFLWVSPPNNH